MRPEARDRFEPLDAATFDRHVLGVLLEHGADAPNKATVYVTANLVATNAGAFRRTVTTALDAGATELTIDLTRCPYADSRGLGALVAASNMAKRHGGHLSIANACDDLRTLFQLTQLDHVFHVCPEDTTQEEPT